MRLQIGTTALFLFGSLLHAGGVQLGGWLQNDTAGLLRAETGIFGNRLESRAVLQYRAKRWRVYSDLRLSLYTGNLYEGINKQEFSLLRSFLRINTSRLEMTIGRTYLNFGVPLLFNPFEMDKAFSLNDTTKIKTGREAVSMDISLGDFSGFKFYTAPENPVWRAGGALYTRIAGIDISLICNREGKNTNICGISLKGDLLLGITLAAAVHLDDAGGNPCFEGTALLDYSFGTLFLSAGCYINGRGKTDPAEYDTSVPQDSYSLGRLILFSQNRLRVDEFISLQLDAFCNPLDSSIVLLPGVNWTILDGLQLYTVISIPLGEDGDEYAPARLGDLGALVRIRAKF